jgi:hypothetical protein
MLAGSSELFRVANFGDLQVWDRPLVSVVASTLDTTLLDPTNAGITDVKPASLTNGLTTIPPLLDFQNQVGQVLAAICGGSPTKPVLIVSLQTALRLAALPTLTDYVKVLVSPATTNKLIAIDADGVGFVDDGGTVDIGTPDIEMSDTPANPNVASTVMISSWQRNLKVLRCTRWVNWTKRPDAVAMLMLA